MGARSRDSPRPLASSTTQRRLSAARTGLGGFDCTPSPVLGSHVFELDAVVDSALGANCARSPARCSEGLGSTYPPAVADDLLWALCGVDSFDDPGVPLPSSWR